MHVFVKSGRAEILTQPEMLPQYRGGQFVTTIASTGWLGPTTWSLGSVGLGPSGDEEHPHVFTFEWSALQPGRARLVQPILWIVPSESGEIRFAAKIYADSFATPVELESSLYLDVTRCDMDFGKMVEQERFTRDRESAG